ncbi:MAG: hypothetical protein JNK12_12235 [Acidimicrobiales bacterium]|nr:hypothetical protein [Acidimicrobiales bacterium]
MSDAPREPPSGEPPLPASRLEELVGRVSVLARRLSRPVGIAGRIGLVAGLGVWLLLPAPVWPDRPPWWSSAVSLLVLCAPGGWLMFHRWWLDRAAIRATELAPAATATALKTYARIRGTGEPGDAAPGSGGGRVRRAWRFYRGTISPLQGHVTDALGITAPFRPYTLITSGVALVLTLALLICVPVALVVRVVLLVT